MCDKIEPLTELDFGEGLNMSKEIERIRKEIAEALRLPEEFFIKMRRKIMVKNRKKPNISAWKDKYGNEIPIKEMPDFHLKCAIRCLERYAKDREKNLRSRLSAIIDDRNAPSQLRTSAEKKLTTLDVEGFSISKTFPKYPKLCEEAMRRDLI